MLVLFILVRKEFIWKVKSELYATPHPQQNKHIVRS